MHWLVSHCGEVEVGTNTLTGESSWGGEEEGKDETLASESSWKVKGERVD